MPARVSARQKGLEQRVPEKTLPRAAVATPADREAAEGQVQVLLQSEQHRVSAWSRVHGESLARPECCQVPTARFCQRVPKVRRRWSLRSHLQCVPCAWAKRRDRDRGWREDPEAGPSLRKTAAAHKKREQLVPADEGHLRVRRHSNQAPQALRADAGLVVRAAAAAGTPGCMTRPLWEWARVCSSSAPVPRWIPGAR
jgi:hypothetical protein